MLRIQVTVEVNRILMNPMNEEYNPPSGKQLEDLRTGVRTPKREKVIKPNPRDEAAEKIYRDREGKIGIPAGNLRKCLVIGGRDVTIPAAGGGRAQTISTATSTKLYSFLTIEEEFLPFLDQEAAEKWEVDKRRGVGGSRGKPVAVCLVRPKFIKPRFRVTFELDDRQVKEEIIQRLFWISGKRVGLCDFRPDRGGDFGMFRVVEWKVLQKYDSKDFMDFGEEIEVAKAKEVSTDNRPRRKTKIAGIAAGLGVLAAKAWIAMTSAMS